MIIKRKYSTYGQLLNDEASKEVIYNAIANSKHPLDGKERDRILAYVTNLIVLNTDLGSGIPGDAYKEIIACFDKLDEEQPFDNGLTYRDVNGVLTYPSRKGTAVMQIMYNHIMDLTPVIVQVIAFETKGTDIIQVEPWDVGDIVF